MFFTPTVTANGSKRINRTDNIQRYWYPEISVDVITMVGVTVKEALSDIRINARIAVIHL